MAKGSKPTRAELVERNVVLGSTVELFQERLAELEFALEDQGWRQLGGGAEAEFSRGALRIIARQSRLMFIKNPLISHGVEVQTDYVLGRPVSITSEDPDVDAVVQRFLDDPKNRAEFTDPVTMALKETDIQCFGNLFLPLFTNRSTGAVHVRSIPLEEISEIITDPEDRRSPQYYKREWDLRTLNVDSGQLEIEHRTTYYPDWRYQPETQPLTIAGKPVEWDAPVMHLKIGGTSDMQWGVPSIYKAIDWARSVVRALEDYATVQRAYARYAQSLTVKGGAVARKAAKDLLQTTIGPEGIERNPPNVPGGTFIQSEAGAKLETIRTGGAQTSPEDGRRLWLMVGAGLNLPETILSGNAEVGNLATAQTLDRPTELHMTRRQTFWKSAIGDLLDYVIRQAVEAPSGLLNGLATIENDELTEEPTIVWKDDRAVEVNVEFADVIEHDPENRIRALIDLATMQGRQSANTMPDRLVSRLGMQYLGVDDIDDQLEQLYPDGEETPPTGLIGVQPLLPGTLLGPDGQPLPGRPPLPEPKPPFGAAESILARLGELVAESRADQNGHELEDLEVEVAETVVERDGKHCVVSGRGKNLGCYDTHAEAVKRLGQVEYFKSQETAAAHAGVDDILEALDEAGLIVPDAVNLTEERMCWGHPCPGAHDYDDKEGHEHARSSGPAVKHSHAGGAAGKAHFHSAGKTEWASGTRGLATRIATPSLSRVNARVGARVDRMIAKTQAGMSKTGARAYARGVRRGQRALSRFYRTS
jgi:hypothetical protein